VVVFNYTGDRLVGDHLYVPEATAKRGLHLQICQNELDRVIDTKKQKVSQILAGWVKSFLQKIGQAKIGRTPCSS
jgi:hypothetical protein